MPCCEFGIASEKMFLDIVLRGKGIAWLRGVFGEQSEDGLLQLFYKNYKLVVEF